MATEHSKLAMSSAERWMQCPASLWMAEQYPEVKQSEYAAEGTRAHAVAEKILADALQEGITIKEAYERHKDKADNDEMRGYVLDYCNQVKEILPLQPERICIEKKFALSKDLGGTADCGFVARTAKGERVGVIIDLKYGAGVAVDVEGNAQLAGYACAMHRTEEWGPLDRAVVYIFQPRAEHPDGPLRAMRLGRAELDNWADRLIKRGDVALKELARKGKGIKRTYCPGDWCRWCRGEAVCTALQKSLAGDSGVDFAPAVPTEPPLPETLPAEKVVAILKNRSKIESYLKRVVEWATAQLESGNKIEGLKLVRGRSVRQWINDSEYVADQLEKLGCHAPWQQKLIGITEAEKCVGKGKIGSLTETPEGKLTVATLDDPRPEADLGGTSSAAQDFEFN